MSKDKEVLLKTPMNQLGLSRQFGSLFEGEDKVLTLEEFFTRNSSLFYVKYPKEGVLRVVEYFHCFPADSICTHIKFKRTSKSFKNLYELLREKGLNHTDWVFLLPKTKRGEFDYQKLSKETIGVFPISRIVDVQVASSKQSPFCKIIELTLGEEVNPFKVTVNDFISLSTLKALCGNSKLKPTLENIQEELRSYGFTQRDGAFMGIRFKKK